MQEVLVREQINVRVTKKRAGELRLLARELDMPVSILIREGINMIIQKYKSVLLEAQERKQILKSVDPLRSDKFDITSDIKA